MNRLLAAVGALGLAAASGAAEPFLKDAIDRSREAERLAEVQKSKDQAVPPRGIPPPTSVFRATFWSNDGNVTQIEFEGSESSIYSLPKRHIPFDYSYAAPGSGSSPNQIDFAFLKGDKPTAFCLNKEGVFESIMLMAKDQPVPRPATPANEPTEATKQFNQQMESHLRGLLDSLKKIEIQPVSSHTADTPPAKPRP